MAADPPAPADREARPVALSDDIGELKALLEALQSGLTPGVQSALRERSQEVQRLAGELAGRDESLQELQVELEAARTRIAELEREVERWQEAARRGVEEIGEQARAAAEAFRAEIACMSQDLAARAEEIAVLSREGGALKLELAAAQAEVERGRSRLKKAQAAYAEVTDNPWWRATALLREPGATWTNWLKKGARLRRRLTKG
jgi:chromosome segregation ATPase